MTKVVIIVDQPSWKIILFGASHVNGGIHARTISHEEKEVNRCHGTLDFQIQGNDELAYVYVKPVG